MKTPMNVLSLMIITAAFVGCGRKTDDASMPRISPPVAPARASAVPSEESVLKFLQGSLGNQLPPHFIVRSAPIEVLGEASGVAKVRIRLQIEALDASFAPVGHVSNQFGKSFTLVKRVYVQGEKFEFAYITDTFQTLGGPAVNPPSFGKKPEEFGLPISQLTNAYDITSEVGQRLQAAPEALKKAQRWIDEQAGRKVRFDQLKVAFDEKRSPADAYSAILALYPEAKPDMEAAAPLPGLKRKPYDDRVQKLLNEQFPSDFARFSEKYGAAQSVIASETKFLNEL
jgi:hypothetical protein